MDVGICEDEARLLNAPFIKFATTQRPWIILKWAQSVDGKLDYADKTGKQRWISNDLSRSDAHNLRRRAQAIIVGINTVIADDPLLTPRPSRGRDALRIVLDSFLRIPLECKLLATADEAPVLILTDEKAVAQKPDIAEQITRKGAELLAYPDMDGKSNLIFLLDELSKRGVPQLLVEGGRTVISSFIKEHLADEIDVYIAPKILCAQGSVDISESMARLSEAVGLRHVDIKRFGDDVRISGLIADTL